MNTNNESIYPFYRKFTNSSFSRVLLLCCSLCLMYGCKDDDAPDSIPNTNISGDEIVIYDIANIPGDVTFDKVKAEITGADWQVIATVESAYKDGKAILLLPSTFSRDKLQKVVRSHKSDYAGCWDATTDNNNARVASLTDITAYNNNEVVGIIYLTDWTGEGTIADKSWIYYHYTDQPFTLETRRDSIGSQIFDASFQEGWNAYANTNRTEESKAGSILCTTTIAEEIPLRWNFKPLY